jgi:hypothetical protein
MVSGTSAFRRRCSTAENRVKSARRLGARFTTLGEQPLSRTNRRTSRPLRSDPNPYRSEGFEVWERPRTSIAQHDCFSGW